MAIAMIPKRVSGRSPRFQYADGRRIRLQTLPVDEAPRFPDTMGLERCQEVVGHRAVNDTVIVCDRVRENMRKIKRESLEGIINTSINETLSRTIITTGTAILVLLALFVLGGGVIRPFAFALLVGFFSGVYSTIFIASPVVLFWEKRPIRKPTGALSVSSTKK